MFGGLDPKKMQAMMRQMGIKQEEIEAERVIIECSDKHIIIEEPSVAKITMQGQDSWQISGKVREEAGDDGIREEDVRLVMEKTGKNEKDVRKALDNTGGDIAEAITLLS